MISSGMLVLPPPCSYQPSSQLIPRTFRSDSPWTNLPTSLRLSNGCMKRCIIRAQGSVNPIPSGNLGNKNHPRKLVGPTAVTTAPSTISPPDNAEFQRDSGGDGIGMVEFLEGKNYFITGATGLLAKVFMEKILRMSPNVGKIYVLIRAKDEETALKRLKDEIIECEVFQHQRQKYGDQYREFMLSKLVPVVGDIGESNLGIKSQETMGLLTEEVDVIVNSAANTVLDERYDVALNMNTSGTLRALELAKNCKKLRVFLHVSTAYVNGTRQGLLMEKHFQMGQSIAVEKSISERKPLPPPLDVDEEIKFASYLVNTIPENEVAQKMKEVGMARATSHGWQNTYQFTKAMAEMVIHSSRGEVPVIIIRPSVIESTYQEPFPGWIQGNRVLEPVIITYGKGRLPGFLADPEVVLDIVPLDVVVNSMVATVAKHGKSAASGLFVYHVTSSTVNPCTMYDLFKSFHDHFATTPLTDAKGSDIKVDEVRFFLSVDDFQSHVEKDVLEKSMVENGATESKPKVNGLDKKNKRIVENITHLGKIYEPYFFNHVRFDNSNADKLIREMSFSEKLDFPMDMRRIDWQDYFVNIHIPGVRKHVMKKPLMSA